RMIFVDRTCDTSRCSLRLTVATEADVVPPPNEGFLHLNGVQEHGFTLGLLPSILRAQARTGGGTSDAERGAEDLRYVVFLCRRIGKALDQLPALSIDVAGDTDVVDISRVDVIGRTCVL